MTPPTPTHTHIWDGGDLPHWLQLDDYHFDYGQLVIYTPDGHVRPDDGWWLIGWSDGTITAASPTSGERVYGAGGITDRLERAEAATDGELRRQLADAIRALGKAETELAGVRALRDRWIKAGPPPLGSSISRWWDKRLAELGAALRPERQGVHRYLSTGCLHGDHAYCKNMTGLNGAKRPGSCKHCGARCICGCHTAPGPAATEATHAPGWLLAGSRDLSIPDPEDLTGAYTPDPPIGCLTTAGEAHLAQDGIHTPGCDCGHDGMGVSWHGDDCLWRRSVVDCPGRPAPG